MKTKLSFVALFFFLLLSTSSLTGQVDLATFTPEEGKEYVIELTDGKTFTGKILSYDARELKIMTREKGEIIVPKLMLEKIFEPGKDVFDLEGNYIGEDRYATRYFLTTNGLAIKRGEHYGQLNIYGPEVHFAVADNFGVGIMSSWILTPMLGTVKYSFSLSENVSMALGGLGGFIGWFRFDQGIALPYVTITFGDRRSNLSFTGGYGAYFDEGDTQGRPLFSVAGLHKFSKKYSLVLDSFLAPKDEYGFGIITLGVRYQSKEKSALQFGASTLWVEDFIVPIPIPTASLFISL